MPGPPAKTACNVQVCCSLLPTEWQFQFVCDLGPKLPQYVKTHAFDSNIGDSLRSRSEPSPTIGMVRVTERDHAPIRAIGKHSPCTFHPPGVPRTHDLRRAPSAFRRRRAPDGSNVDPPRISSNMQNPRERSGGEVRKIGAESFSVASGTMAEGRVIVLSLV